MWYRPVVWPPALTSLRFVSDADLEFSLWYSEYLKYERQHHESLRLTNQIWWLVVVSDWNNSRLLERIDNQPSTVSVDCPPPCLIDFTATELPSLRIRDRNVNFEKTNCPPNPHIGLELKTSLHGIRTLLLTLLASIGNKNLKSLSYLISTVRALSWSWIQCLFSL